MITVLDRPLRRQVTIDGQPYVVTISPEGVRVILKGRRKGPTIPWSDILSGAVTLDAQLIGSLAARSPHADTSGDEGSGDASTGKHERPTRRRD